MKAEMRTGDLHTANGQARKRAKRPSLRARVDVAGWMAIVMLSFSATGFASKVKPNPAIKILVYNVAQVPRATLTLAEREATHILSQAGVRARWFECPAVLSDAEARAICQNGWGPINLGLRLLVKPKAFDSGRQDHLLGFAIFPALASVYYDAKLRFVGDDVGLGLPSILGCFIAHEVGHLLLGPNSHSKQGVMQAKWAERQIRQAVAGNLLFTSNQVKLIQAETRRRVSPQKGTPALASFPSQSD
jgi:hypothetical protein